MNDLIFRKEHYCFIELSGDNFRDVCSFLGVVPDVISDDAYIDAIKGLQTGKYTKLVCKEIAGSETMSVGDYIFKISNGDFCVMKKELFDYLFIRY